VSKYGNCPDYQNYHTGEGEYVSKMSFLDGLDLAWTFIKVVGPFILLAIVVQLIREIPYWIEEHRAKSAGVIQTDKMNGDMFEKWLAHQFKRAGYKVRVTPYSQDHGADLILTKQDSTKIAVQAKKLSKRRDRVGSKALGEIMRGQKFYNCQEAWVVTNQGFTQQAREEARKYGIHLMGRRDLVDYVEKLNLRKK